MGAGLLTVAGRGLERRRHPRRAVQAHEPLVRLRLRTGWDMRALDVSANGALVEGGARLLPGTHVDAHVFTRDGRVLLRARVARAYVSDLRRDAVTYRAALAFERRLDAALHGYALPAPAADAEVIRAPVTRDTMECRDERVGNSL